MEIGGYNRVPDWPKMGPTLVIASSLILAIRTAKWQRQSCDTIAQPEWDAEVEQAIKLAHRVLSHLVTKSPFLFPHKDVPWYQPTDDESPK